MFVFNLIFRGFTLDLLSRAFGLEQFSVKI